MVRSQDRLDYDGVQQAVDARLRRRAAAAAQGGRARSGSRWSASAGARACRCPSRRSPRTSRATTGCSSGPPLEVGGLERAALADDRHGRRRDDDQGAGVGILRTMPPPDAGRRRPVPARRPKALGVDVAGRACPTASSSRTLDRANPQHLALIHEATALFRGRRLHARSTARCPSQPQHAAVAAPYAHVTAPLRRLVDRFGLVVCEALCAGRRRAGLGPRGAARAARGSCRPPTAGPAASSAPAPTPSRRRC